MARSDNNTGDTLRQAMTRVTVETSPRAVHDVTPRLAAWLSHVGAGDGLLTIFLRHTSASIAILENTDPDVRLDLTDALDRIAPVNMPYRHDLEGPDDMPAHIKSVLIGSSLTVPVMGGQLDLGTWQAIYMIEHRVKSHSRRMTLHYLGT